ncbi:lacto-N-biose phosphorylase central domain-containing protein [Vibrio sp. M60_M31a]
MRISAWSGGERWNDPKVIVALRQFVAEGGGLLGVSEPSA